MISSLVQTVAVLQVEPVALAQAEGEPRCGESPDRAMAVLLPLHEKRVAITF